MLLDLSELRRLNVARVRCFGHTLEQWSALEWAGAMAGEAGEAANVAKKLRRVGDGCTVNAGDRDALRAKLAEELADVIIYADLLAAREGIDLGDALVAKFDAVSGRVGFPDRLSPFQPDHAEVRRVLSERLKRSPLVYFDDAVADTAGVIAKWDAGQLIPAVSLGGLGPGYEQAIVVMAVEFARAILAARPDSVERADAVCTETLRAIDDAVGGASGAQFGAARTFAIHAALVGWTRLRAAYPFDRHISACRFSPVAPPPPGETRLGPAPAKITADWKLRCTIVRRPDGYDVRSPCGRYRFSRSPDGGAWVEVNDPDDRQPAIFDTEVGAWRALAGCALPPPAETRPAPAPAVDSVTQSPPTNTTP